MTFSLVVGDSVEKAGKPNNVGSLVFCKEIATLNRCNCIALAIVVYQNAPV
jgi:hypothetical protein